jgi:CSLREA domain-containing protein
MPIAVRKRLSGVLAVGTTLILGVSGASLLLPAEASAATLSFTVTTKADSHDATPGNGVCADSASRCSLRAAIEEADAAPPGSSVVVAVPANVYKLSLGTLALTHNTIAVDGAAGVVLKEKAAHQVVSIASQVHASLSDLTIQGGQGGTASGGGLGNAGTTMLASVTVTKNTAASGGGVANAKGAILTLTGSTVSGNSAASATGYSKPGGAGGGIVNAGSLVLTDSTVAANQAGSGGQGRNNPAGNGGNGGGIANTGTLTATASTVSENGAGWGGLGLAGNEASGAGGNGGGIYAAAGSSTALTDSTVEGNASGNSGPAGESAVRAGDGGGVWSAGTLTVSGSSVSSNTGGQGTAGGGNGGGIFTTGTASVLSSTLSEDSGGAGSGPGGSGGGIANNGTLTLTDTTLSGDTGGAGGGSSNGGGGGGLYTPAGSASLSGDTFTADAGGNGGNAVPVDPGCTTPGRGGDGGAILSAAVLALTNSTLSGNTDGQGGFYFNPCAGQAPDGVGAGLANDGGSATLSYATVADNTDGIDNLAGAVTLGGTIVAASTAANCIGTVSETSGFNLDSANSCGFSAATDLTGADPMLAGLAANGGFTETQALAAGSPAIDAGGTAVQGCPVTDQRGVTRPDEASDNGACDIGAFES